MNIELILAKNTPPGQKTQEIWQSACNEAGTNLQIHDIDSVKARILTDQLNIKTFPALIANEKVIAVGHPDQETAGQIIQSVLSSIPGN